MWDRPQVKIYFSKPVQRTPPVIGSDGVSYYDKITNPIDMGTIRDGNKVRFLCILFLSSTLTLLQNVAFGW